LTLTENRILGRVKTRTLKTEGCGTSLKKTDCADSAPHFCATRPKVKTRTLKTEGCGTPLKKTNCADSAAHLWATRPGKGVVKIRMDSIRGEGESQNPHP
jgi:hypothetical protein